MKDYEFGRTIDSYDVVIRLNTALDLCAEYPLQFGQKTTILFAALPYSVHTKIYQDDYLNYIIKNNIFVRAVGKYYFPNMFIPNMNNFITKKNKFPVNVSFMDESESFFVSEIHKHFQPSFHWQLSTGTTAFLDTLFHEPKKLVIYGIGFFQDKKNIYLSDNYHALYKIWGKEQYAKKALTHDMELEKKIWRNFASFFNHIEVDLYMKDILQL